MFRTALSRSSRQAAAFARAGAGSVRSKHTLPDLAYDYGALEPAISGEIMELHHTKHHQNYVNGLNQAEEVLAQALHSKDVKTAIATQKAINFNGGGHINHTLFWANLAPQSQGGGELHAGALKDAIDRDFGGLEQLKAKFNAQIAAVQGSGWGWVGYNPTSKKLDILTTANQDPLLSHVPVIGVDAWEHAFYLQYKNNKGDYFKNVWNVINFKAAEERLLKAQ
ncbi:manganese and iron superoxide dismutase [Violaceomyces palustris]|uniref:Manganese and iron superoxide dismutase n=1 Tax=Violaceomyces palustris TaxID=1673888 RepID=A0ACD0NYX0_9BASI|nr:manganese and iron superoxide dismutase [Violaceomyces palustris]